MDMMGFFGDEMITVTLHRVAVGFEGEYVNGEWVNGDLDITQPVQIIAPQPARASDLQMLPSGERSPDYLVSWTAYDLDTRTGTTESDVIEFEGNRYKVMDAEKRRLGNFRKILLHLITHDEQEY